MRLTTPTILAVCLLWLCPLRTASADVAADTRVDPASPPPALVAVRDAIASRGAVTCDFSESRSFPFRKTPALLAGTSTFLPGRGLVLRYASPQARTVALVPQGLVEQGADGSRKLRTLPPQYENMLAVYDLNLRDLAADFDIFFGSDGDRWTVRLDQRTNVAKVDKQHAVQNTRVSIVLHGAADRMERLEMLKPGTITIAIDMTGVRPLSASELAQMEGLLKP